MLILPMTWPVKNNGGDYIIFSLRMVQQCIKDTDIILEKDKYKSIVTNGATIGLDDIHILSRVNLINLASSFTRIFKWTIAQRGELIRQ